MRAGHPTLNLSATFSGTGRGAVRLRRVHRKEAPPTGLTQLRLRGVPLTTTTVSRQGRSTVWANNPEILEAIVVADAVGVVEDQRHRCPVPLLPLTAKLALAPLDSFRVKAPLEVASRVRRALDQDLCQGSRLIDPSQRFKARAAGVKVRSVDLPSPRPLLDRGGVAARNAVAEAPQGGSPRGRSRHRLPQLRLCEADCHERMFVCRPDGLRGPPCLESNPDPGWCNW